MEDKCKFGKTSKGKDTVCFKMFEYYKHKENQNNSVRWRCREYQRKKCRTFITTLGNRVISHPYPEHSHFPDGNGVEARAAVAEMKSLITGIGATPSAVIGSQSQNLSSETVMRLPKKPSLLRTLQRVTQNSGAFGRPPNSIDFEIPEKFKEVLLYDSGIDDPERFLLLGDQEMIAGLSRADIWLADGTFKVVPSIFFQLYTIHFHFGEGRNPAAIYALLCNKNRITYRRMLDAVRQIVPGAEPKQILLDFEIAAMNEFRNSYPNTEIKGCFFHLSQSVYRKAQELGMKAEMESNQELATLILCLPALALVPVDSVEESFDILADAMPEHERMDELLSYFEHTYIRGRSRRNATTRCPVFSLETWNHFENAAEGVARTTNAVEGWHYALQSIFQCSHPTLWTFLEGILKDISLHRLNLVQGIAGAALPPVKKYLAVKRNIQQIVAQFGQSNVITYLKAVQYSSCK